MSEEASAPILAAIGAMGERMDALSVHLTRVDVKLDDVRSDLMARMDRVQDTLTAQRDDGTVTFAAADRAEHLARGAREEARTLGAETRTSSE